MLACKNLTLNYYENMEMATLKEISIKLPSNGIIGITGASGSGKSSFLYALAGLKQKYCTGDVIYGKDQNYSKLSEKEMIKLRGRDFGFVFQKHFLISYLTVMENALVVLNNYDKREEAKTLLKCLSMEEFEERKPKTLSVGQCQRVAIVRALLNNPKVIFADEPTAALDSKSCHQVMELLKEISKDKLVLLVSHDKKVFPYFTECLHFEDGRIVGAER